MTTHDLAIDARGLSRTQGDFVLGPVSLTVERGTVLGFVGANGSGKTTTIKTLLGMAPLDSGTATLLGAPIGQAHDRIGTVLDTPNLVPDWRPRDAARAIRPFRPGWNDQTFEELLDRFQVPRNTKIKDLSRGQGSKLSLSLALSFNPELLILDEPTSGLDPVAREDVLDALRRYMEEPDRSILFSTHIIGDLERIADRVHILRRGRTVFDDTAIALVEEHAMARGPLSALTPDARAALIGIRTNGHTFSGLTRAEDTAAFGPDVVIEAATLADVAARYSDPGSTTAMNPAVMRGNR